MTVRAYLFLETEGGKAKSVAKRIAGLESVSVAHPVTGTYDVIALVTTDSIKTLGDFVVTKIQGLEGVTRTETSVIVE